jgi:hypothetical protein
MIRASYSANLSGAAQDRQIYVDEHPLIRFVWLGMGNHHEAMDSVGHVGG